MYLTAPQVTLLANLTWHPDLEPCVNVDLSTVSGGCPNGKNPAQNNPQFSIQLLEDAPVDVFVALEQDEKPGQPFVPIAFYLLNNNGMYYSIVKGLLMTCCLLQLGMLNCDLLAGKRVSAISTRDALVARSGAFKPVREGI